MPKIITREKDKSTLAPNTYNSFSVVVPGFVATGTDFDTVKDENGVYECSSLEDFKKHIGCVKTINTPNDAAYATVYKTGSFNTEVSSKTEFDLYDLTVTYKNYIICKATKASSTTAHKNVAKVNKELYSLTELKSEDDLGTLVDGDLVYICTDLGREANELTITHVGNQVAYELVNLGYTVLYKSLGMSISDEAIKKLNEEDFWDCFRDKAVYDFRYVITGLINNNTDANNQIIKLAKFDENVNFDSADVTTLGRGDITALLDIDEAKYLDQTQAAAIKEIKNVTSTGIGKYTAYFAPTFIVKESYFGSSYPYKSSGTDTSFNRKFPASFFYLAAAIKARNSFREWYAVAGYTRGIIDLPVEKTTVTFGEAAVNALEPRQVSDSIKCAVNPIIKLGSSYYLWGNRTAEELSNEDLKYSHFLNIRQLCSTLKKQIYIASRRLTFDPNSDNLWINWTNAIRPTLEEMRSDQGIENYVFVKDTTSKKGYLKASVRIIPIEAVEDFDITVSLEDSIEGVLVTVEE